MKTSDSITNPTPVMITVLPLLSMLAAILPSVINNNANLDTVKLGVITLLLTGAAVFYIRINAELILAKKLAKTIISLGYLCSIFLLLFIPNPETFSFWMFGGLLVSMLVDNKLGLFLHFNLSIIMGIMITKNPEDVIQVLIVGALMSMLAGALKRITTVIYASIIILSTNITLAFAINNFVFDMGFNHNYLKSLFSVFTVLFTAYVISVIYQANEKKKSTKYTESVEALLEAYSQDQTLTVTDKSGTVSMLHNEDRKTSATDKSGITSKLNENQKLSATDKSGITSKLNENQKLSATDKSGATSMLHNKVQTAVYACSIIQDNAEAMKDEVSVNTPVVIQLNPGTRTSYDVLCNLENDLIMKMKQHSEALYAHAVLIGDLSYRAAVEIGANEMLAMAGGLYHEVGKIKGKNYIEEGLRIAEDYAFPKELKSILKEHNIKYEKPSSIEAAIVMLSDSVASTIEYIKKSDEHKFTANKIIENIFQLRMDKGTFDLTNFSLKNYKRLKEFYEKEFNK